MPAELNHTIVHVRDNEESSRFLAEILDLPEPKQMGHFMAVEMANGVTLDFMNTDGPVMPQHYAFLISEEEFDQSFARIQERKLSYWANPFKTRPGEVRNHNGGRGVYFEDPSGHFLEILTQPA